MLLGEFCWKCWTKVIICFGGTGCGTAPSAGSADNLIVKETVFNYKVQTWTEYITRILSQHIDSLMLQISYFLSFFQFCLCRPNLFRNFTKIHIFTIYNSRTKYLSAINTCDIYHIPIHVHKNGKNDLFCLE